LAKISHWIKVSYSLTLIQVAIKKCIEWRLQVQIAFETEVDLAPMPPRIAMQRIWTAGQVNVAWGLRFWLAFDERITLKNHRVSL
jgi:hypothetical protein